MAALSVPSILKADHFGRPFLCRLIDWPAPSEGIACLAITVV